MPHLSPVLPGLGPVLPSLCPIMSGPDRAFPFA